MKTYMISLFRLLFPVLCVVCKQPLVDAEKTICLRCLYAMPRTKYAFLPDNPVEQLFWGKVPIYKAMAWCHFAKGGTLQTLLHALKYKNQPQVGVVLGNCLAAENRSWLEGIDVMIPIPLHTTRLRNRGYNQAACVARGIAQETGIEVNEQVLQRVVQTATQTKKRVFERWQNASGIFHTSHADSLQGKHVLLIDDVITTGATLASAAITLQQNVSHITISIATLAVASA